MSKTRMMQPDRSNEEARRAMVTALHHDERGTVLRTTGSSGSTLVALADKPDIEGARRRLRALRRIDGVELRVGPSSITARTRGKRNRLPYFGPVSVAVALGLTELGVRTRVVNGAG